jgi:hypothetical protein
MPGNVRIISTDETLDELRDAAHRAGQVAADGRQSHDNDARKNRGYPLQVDFLTAENTGSVIADGFIIRPDGREIHVRDPQSGPTAEAVQQPPPA